MRLNKIITYQFWYLSKSETFATFVYFSFSMKKELDSRELFPLSSSSTSNNMP